MTRVVLIGLDAFDPGRFERLYDQGRLPNLGRYVAAGAYRRLEVANPPQSEVSWTSIATGLNPGSHGLFDFVHRDPHSYALNVSLLPTKRGVGGTNFVPPYAATTIFDQVVQQGYPATVMWWPATFPARLESPVRTLPGLGTPDIVGRLGVGTFFTTNKSQLQQAGRKTPLAIMQANGQDGRLRGTLVGPMGKSGNDARPTVLDVELIITGERSGRLKVGRQIVELKLGQWSPIIELSFKVGRFFSVHAITRFILSQVGPELRLYALPLQIHPLHSPWRYATPQSFAKQVWHEVGPFLTIGWPQDTTALEEGYIDDRHFLDLCDSIVSTRERILNHQIDHFREGILACVFDTLDRVQHMFWRDQPEVIDAWYVKLDALVGRVEERLRQRGLQDKTQIVIVSDHGFTRFDHKAHLNHWLIERGFLATSDGNSGHNLSAIDWSHSRAYAIGLNSIYLNQQGREGQGSVPLGQREALLNELCRELEAWQGPDGRPVVQKAYRRDEVLEGSLAEYGPDVIVGFSPGYRASQETGLGAWGSEALEANHEHWGADHCVDAAAVPGVIFATEGLGDYERPTYRDIPALTIGTTPDASGSGPPPTPMSDESQKVIEERLKSLGYL